LNQISYVFSKAAHRTQHEINRDVANGVATFIGAQGGSSQWPPLSEIMNFKKPKPLIEFPFIWLNNITHVERKESKFI
jgi:hypothetical protein